MAAALPEGVIDRGWIRIATRWVGANRLANVVRLNREMSDTGLEPHSVDAAVTALNFHDIYNDDPAAASAWLAAIRGLLKPGGVFGVIDHIGNSEADNATLHRIEERLVIDAVEAVGFRVEATSDVLRNSDDDRTKGVFDPSVRGHNGPLRSSAAQSLTPDPQGGPESPAIDLESPHWTSRRGASGARHETRVCRRM